MCFNHVLKVNIGLCFSIYSTDCWFRCNNSSVLSWEGGWMQIHFGSSSFRSKFICSFVLRFSFCYFNLFSTSPLILFLPPTSLSLSPHIPQLSLSLCPPLSPLHNFEFPINRSGLPQNEQMQSCQSVNSKFLSYLNLCPSQSYKPCPNTNAKWKSTQ